MYPLSVSPDWPRPQALRRPTTATVFFAAAAWLAALAWLRPLALPDEGRYVGVALEMLHSRDWLTPTLDGLPFLHKPPLFYWITAASMHLFGASEWPARLASILAGSLTVVLMYSACRRWLGEVPARRSALVLATQPLFFGASQFANMDMLVAACIAGAIVFGAQAARHADAGHDPRGWLVAAWAAAAAGVLSKGLIGVVIPALVLVLWLALRGRRQTLRALGGFTGPLLFAAIVAPWFVAAQRAHPAFFHDFFIVQHLHRFASGGFNNVEPFWFYGPMLLAFTLPWSLWLFARRARSLPVGSTQADVRLLMGVWLGVVVVFFSIPASKPVGYVLPALPPLAVLVVMAASGLLDASRRARSLWSASLATALALCVGVTAAYAVTRPKSTRDLAATLNASADSRAGVASIDEFPYDLPFYAARRAPLDLFVVADWNPADVERHDDWRRELADGARIAPQAAAGRLLSAGDLRAALCAGRVKWIVAKSDAARAHPFLNDASIAASTHGQTLWKVDAATPALAAALACPAAPAGAATAHHPGIAARSGSTKAARA